MEKGVTRINHEKKKLTIQLNASIIPFSHVETKFFEGSKKNDLTGWWLHLIEQSVEEFVHSLPGWTKNAIPYNYLDQAPTSLEIIQQNLELLRQLIDPQKYGDVHQVRERLILPLSNQIYCEIDVFLRQAQLLCINVILEAHHETKQSHRKEKSEELKQFSDENQTRKKHQNGKSTLSNFDFQQDAAREQIKELKQQPLSSSFFKRLEGLEEIIRDIQYIEEMKRLESHFHPESQNTSEMHSPHGSVSDIVPITGLIIGALHRMENEHKTVIEHWSSRISRRR